MKINWRAIWLIWLIVWFTYNLFFLLVPPYVWWQEIIFAIGAGLHGFLIYQEVKPRE